MKRRAWLTLGAVVLGGGGVVSYAVASPSTDQGTRPKRPVKVYDLALKGALDADVRVANGALAVSSWKRSLC